VTALTSGINISSSHTGSDRAIWFAMSPSEVVRPRGVASYVTPNCAPITQWRRMRGVEKVAAVCYRVNRGELEFLLVETGGGRWTFPKGNIEAGLSHAESAALEAFEEAGVHGRIEEESFARYMTRKAKSGMQIGTSAYLCEVLWLDEPVEEGRNPSWFRAEKAKRRLREHRTPQDGAEHIRIVELAAGRLWRRLEVRAALGGEARWTRKK